MTLEEKIRRIRALVARRKTDGSQSPENARKLLIEEGVYTKDGQIAPEYGGKSRRKKKVA